MQSSVLSNLSKWLYSRFDEPTRFLKSFIIDSSGKDQASPIAQFTEPSPGRNKL